MKIDEIRKKLISKGYYTYYQGEILIAGTYKGGYKETGINMLENTFSITELDNIIVLEHGQAQLIQEKRFEVVSELFDFIKLKFKK
ncbi:MAG: hypothetical protein GQ574_02440 [Crocinitomix sp.]|nr:hypothetical protein [Crocinitomix sp.]